jgi:hypothetical protein
MEVGGFNDAELGERTPYARSARMYVWRGTRSKPVIVRALSGPIRDFPFCESVQLSERRGGSLAMNTHSTVSL